MNSYNSDPDQHTWIGITGIFCFLFLELIGASVTLGRGKNNYQDNLMRHK